ncbi:AI-2E family transporter [Campylobacter sp. FMV-PI01]|uniref:AI-2E family transporter n=1 Tax=Campylobacter portucalensis TaxID=2608384 RepID=A0A6L5WIW0_9BACT|nr:AI-2E family transporter [Campylobacter portucalensis]MSN95935.1 AI-2E family transporter [Campylobacter portucalensis]
MKTHVTLICLACIVIIFAGLKAASGIFVPFLLAIFIAIIISPLIDYLEKLKIPRVASFFIVIFCFFGILGVLGNITFNAIYDFTAELPEFQKKFKVFFENLIDTINKKDIIYIDANLIGFDPNSIFSTTSAFLKKTSTLLSMSFFIVLLVAFMLFEAVTMKAKINYIDQKNPQTSKFVHEFAYNLKRYLLIKTISSALTGIIIGIGLSVLGIPYATLWGVVAFVLNYIPTIGSVVAAIPALFVTLLSGGFVDFVWVFLIYLVPNTIIGSIVEPKFLGDGLGLSVISVLASLLVWGFVFGVGGLFLAVPLTMSIQIALNMNPKTKLIAILLSNKAE